MAELEQQQGLRAFALVIAFAFCAAFCAGVQLILEQREMDERQLLVLGLLALGAFLGGCIALWITRRVSLQNKALRVLLAFITVSIATLLFQSLLSGIFFYFGTYSEHEPFGTLGWGMELIGTGLHGIAYFFIFGARLNWPLGLGAALLFAMGSLTLHAHSSKT